MRAERARQGPVRSKIRNPIIVEAFQHPRVAEGAGFKAFKASVARHFENGFVLSPAILQGHVKVDPWLQTPLASQDVRNPQDHPFFHLRMDRHILLEGAMLQMHGPSRPTEPLQDHPDVPDLFEIRGMPCHGLPIGFPRVPDNKSTLLSEKGLLASRIATVFLASLDGRVVNSRLGC